MDIFNDVVNNFRTKIDKRFNSYLNEVANYVIFEQTLIKKDNKSKKKSSIKYRYDEKTYNLMKTNDISKLYISANFETKEDAQNWINRHTYKGMSFKYDIVEIEE